MRSPRAGFQQGRRLATPAEFAWVFAHAERSADRYFTVLARTNARSVSRLGLAIARRAAKRAVDRNRLKRIAREVFRHLTLAPVDFVVMARQAAAAADSAALRRSLETHFRQLSDRVGDERNG